MMNLSSQSSPDSNTFLLHSGWTELMSIDKQTERSIISISRSIIEVREQNLSRSAVIIRTVVFQKDAHISPKRRSQKTKMKSCFQQMYAARANTAAPKPSFGPNLFCAFLT
jgi:hypothetical protein